MSTTPTSSAPAQVNGNAAATDINGMLIDVDVKELYYGSFKAVRDTKIQIKKGSITAFIGPSGCGKSTVLRSINRMNDFVRDSSQVLDRQAR